MKATEAGDTAAVLDFLRRGMDINAGAGFNTALERAIWGRQTEMMRLLLEHGADLHAVGRDGLTPLAWAIREGRHEAADLLRRAGATH